MAIKEMAPLSMAEAKELVETIDKENEILDFLKKFAKLSGKESKKLGEELENLGILKFKPENIVKLIDFMPANNLDLNKILLDTDLDDDETNKLLEVIKKYT